MSEFDETIVAISTPPGRGGIGIVRLSGARAREIAAPVLRMRHALAHGMARLGTVVDEAGEVLDEAVVTLFQGPRSYTSEDVVEIAVHGAPVLLEELVRRAIAGGARLAEPGEFTQRAFLSGRLDLTQAEAVHDLIQAQTLHQAKVAAAQLGGAVSAAVAPVKQSLLGLIAALEAGVDFAEDDLDLLPDAEIAARLTSLETHLRALAESYAYGRMVRDGVRLAIVGKPNAGKSSLFNRLLRQERAIVTAQPGTTRDSIAEKLAIGGIPVELVDTAGLREVGPGQEAEREGIRRSRQTMAEADLVVWVVDGSAMEKAEIEGVAASLVVVNKWDLVSEENRKGFFSSEPLRTGKTGILEGTNGDTQLQDCAEAFVFTSAKTGEGIEALRSAIQARLQARPAAEDALLTNLRQAQVVGGALAAVMRAREAAERALPHEFVLLDLHEALEALGVLTGASTPDDVLQLIFASFCIGK